MLTGRRFVVYLKMNIHHDAMLVASNVCQTELSEEAINHRIRN